MRDNEVGLLWAPDDSYVLKIQLNVFVQFRDTKIVVEPSAIKVKLGPLVDVN